MDTEDDIHVLASYLLGGKKDVGGSDSRKESSVVGGDTLEPGRVASDRGSVHGEVGRLNILLTHTYTVYYSYRSYTSYTTLIVAACIVKTVYNIL